MATLSVKHVQTLQGFVSEIESLVADPKEPYWFRGVGDASYPLLPSLYRHPDLHLPDELRKLEQDLLNRFIERSVPYQTFRPSSTWESMFLMQHYGIPTRLLDWTENPMVALFFALTAAYRDSKTKNVTASPAVWALSPRLWNERAFAHVTYKGGPLSVSDQLLKPYTPSGDDEPPALAAAIFGIHNSPRIVAQRGVFTIFGSKVEAMQLTFASETFSDRAIIKYVVPKAAVDSILQKLYATGFTEAVMFPGLDGLAKETKRLFGFKE
ncbi:MAG: FRG domain-containing protein [Candidatus Brocadiia bacterium]